MIKKKLKTGITKRNNIQEIVGYKELKDKWEKQELEDSWKRKVLEQQMITGKTEYHITINPDIINYNEYKLLSIFRDMLIKFYREKLGKHFNKKKEQQMKMLFAPEYGSLYELTGEKHTHLHCIVQADNKNMVEALNTYIKEKMDAYFDKDVYKAKLMDTPEYRINCYNYIRKEGREMFSNTDFYYKKSDKNKLFR